MYNLTSLLHKKKIKFECLFHLLGKYTYPQNTKENNILSDCTTHFFVLKSYILCSKTSVPISEMVYYSCTLAIL